MVTLHSGVLRFQTWNTTPHELMQCRTSHRSLLFPSSCQNQLINMQQVFLRLQLLIAPGNFTKSTGRQYSIEVRSLTHCWVNESFAKDSLGQEQKTSVTTTMAEHTDDSNINPRKLKTSLVQNVCQSSTQERRRKLTRCDTLEHSISGITESRYVWQVWILN